MQMSQYVYGRKPDRGLDVIARSRDLPFYQPDWLNATRYGSAPAEDTPDRVWTQRYELQSLDKGGVLSCLYPLKQTTTPCSLLRPPYPKGITPAVHHMMVADEDWPALLDDPASALTYGGFLAIDDIYALSGGFLDPVAYTPTNAKLALDDGWMEYECAALAAALWRAFMARKQKKLGLLSQCRVLLIVPRTDPERELALQRAILAYTLALLPLHVRRYASLTLNLDVESADLPANSAVYGMSRAEAASQPAVSGVVFDLDRRQTPSATDAERSYFTARAAGKVSPYFDAILAQLPQADELEFCLRLRQVELAVQAADPDVAAVLTKLIEDEQLQQQQAPLLNACVEASLAACRAEASAVNLATLWRLLGIAGVDSYRQACLGTLQPTAENVLAVLVRDAALCLPDKAEIQDDLYCEMAAQRVAGGGQALSEEMLGKLRYLWDHTALPAERLPAWQTLANALFSGRTLTGEPRALAAWAQTTLMLRLTGLVLPEDVRRQIAALDAQALWELLIRMATVNAAAPATTALERLALCAAQPCQAGFYWTPEVCEAVARRIEALKDGAEDWPALLLPYLADNAGTAQCAGQANRMMRLDWVRALPGQGEYIHRLLHAFAVHTLTAAMAAMDDAKQTPQMDRYWRAQAGTLPLPGLEPAYAPIVTARLAALYQPLTAAEAVALYAQLKLGGAYAEYGALARAALGRRAAQLLTVQLSEAPNAELMALLGLVKDTHPALTDEQKNIYEALQAILKLGERTAAAPDDLEWFTRLRAQFTALGPEGRTLAIKTAQRDFGATQAGALLASLMPDGGIDWDVALPALLAYQCGHAVALNGRAALPQDTVDLVLDLLSSLIVDPQSAESTHWLTHADIAALAKEVRRYPALYQSLKREHRRNNDLPQLMLDTLGLL